VLKKTWLIILAVVPGLLFLGAGPSQAAGAQWKVDSVVSSGCDVNDYGFDVTFSGLDGVDNIAHTVVTVGGLVYMNEDAGDPGNRSTEWHLYDDNSYGPTTGTWPIPSGKQMTVRMTIEKPKGTVLSSWTYVTSSCDSTVALYNGPTSADADGDLLTIPTDKCPTVKAATANGCPLWARSLKVKRHKHRLDGQLRAPGHAALAAHREVVIWKKKNGKHHRVAVRKTNAKGKFHIRLKKGRYYVTSPSVIVPATGQARATKSRTVKFH